MNWLGQRNRHQNRFSHKRKGMMGNARTRYIFGPCNLQTFLFVVLLLFTSSTYVNVNAQETTPGPTTEPTAKPTAKPTPSPTPSPTSPPTKEPTAFPSFSPTSRPSLQPVSSPAASPGSNVSFAEDQITITLTGVLPLNDEEMKYFERKTANYIEFYFNPPEDENPNVINEGDIEIYDVDVTINITKMDPPFENDGASRRNLDGIRRLGPRKLNEKSTTLRITYIQSMTYIISKGLPTKENLIQDPFNTITERNNYITFLKGTPSIDPVAEAFAELTKVNPPELFSEKEKVSTVAIIAAAAGGVALVILVTIFVIWRRRRGVSQEVDADYDPRRRKDPLPSSDGGSTMVEPNQQGIYNTQQSIIGNRYGGPGSIATEDPMYQFNHGYEDQTLVSNTDATFDDATRQSTKFSADDSVLGPGGGQSIFSDDQSFENFRNRGGRKEELLEIYAPAGKLGVVIDTPDSGAPVLHRIKETCPIADKLRVGDKLIAVDDEDVKGMTAVEVSKLISLKSTNHKRKFTIIRYA